MTKQDDEEKQNVRMMWMATGAIVLFIVGLWVSACLACSEIKAGLRRQT